MAKEAEVIRAKVTNTGNSLRIIHDVDSKMVTIPPMSSAVLLIPDRQFRDLVKSKNVKVEVSEEELTAGRAKPRPPKPSKEPKGSAGTDGNEGNAGSEGTLSAKSVLDKLESGDLPYRELVEQAKIVLGDEFPEHPAQPKKRDIVELLEARAAKE